MYGSTRQSRHMGCCGRHRAPCATNFHAMDITTNIHRIKVVVVFNQRTAAAYASHKMELGSVASEIHFLFLNEY